MPLLLDVWRLLLLLLLLLMLHQALKAAGSSWTPGSASKYRKRQNYACMPSFICVTPG